MSVLFQSYELSVLFSVCYFLLLLIVTMTSLEQMIAKEKKIRRELDDFVLFNEDQGFTDLDFMVDYKQELQEHYQKFRKIHDELVDEQGDKLHSDTYPDFD